ncbi:hypothetical protein MMC19_002243 [Ptychographa xylographoides]|nr:hypothetical protein [Ptychographa xylographoides]
MKFPQPFLLALLSLLRITTALRAPYLSSRDAYANPVAVDAEAGFLSERHVSYGEAFDIYARSPLDEDSYDTFAILQRSATPEALDEAYEIYAILQRRASPSGVAQAQANMDALHQKGLQLSMQYQHATTQAQKNQIYGQMSQNTHYMDVILKVWGPQGVH